METEMTTNPIVNGRYTIISADCHAGADLLGYRPYLESRWLPEFDAWAGTYEVPFADLHTNDAEVNWNSERRAAELAADGVIAEVVYPNNCPPFFSTQVPTGEDCERRWAGMRAHNRWLADFCAELPGRRAGVAEVQLYDVDAAIEEVKWIKEAGLFGGILLPTVLVNDPLTEPLYSPVYEPLWATCADLGVALHTHGGFMNSAWGAEKYPAGGAIYINETSYFTHRLMTHLILAGVFERHPELRLVMTEQGTGWLPDTLRQIDALVHEMSMAPDSPQGGYGAPVVEALKMKPSEYYARNCWVGASFLRRAEAEIRHEVGVGSIMWGSDYPHEEGTHPFSLEALQRTFSGMPSAEVALMLGGSAADLFGFDLEALAPLAAEFGPSVEAVAQPLAAMPDGAVSSAFS
jgi:predicted TIM-barrel fold metal-dependent hydrolase